MKRKVLKKWVETVLTVYAIISFGLLISINDFSLTAAPVIILLLLSACGSWLLISEYGRN